jgi:hypothetical protein
MSKQIWPPMRLCVLSRQATYLWCYNLLNDGKEMLNFICKYASAFGLAVAILFHICGYFWVGLPRAGSIILRLGWVVLGVIAFIQGRIGEWHEISATRKKLAGIPLLLACFYTIILTVFIRPYTQGSQYSKPFRPIRPIWEIGRYHYQMLHQQWLSSADVTLYLILSLIFASRTGGSPREEETASYKHRRLPTKLAGRRIAFILLTPMALILVEQALESSSLLPSEAGNIVVTILGFGWILGMLFVGIHLILDSRLY